MDLYRMRARALGTPSQTRLRRRRQLVVWSFYTLSTLQLLFTAWQHLETTSLVQKKIEKKTTLLDAWTRVSPAGPGVRLAVSYDLRVGPVPVWSLVASRPCNSHAGLD
jgi:hypothetical protein